MPLIIEVEQGSDDWFDLKLGVPSASNFHQIVNSKGEPSKSWDKYLHKLGNERITRRRENPWELNAFRRGKEMEPESRVHTELKYDCEITSVGFVFKDDKKRFGCSPDGLWDYNGESIKKGFETKDAMAHIQLERLKKGTLPTEHHRQVQGCLYVCEAETWHFRSYCRGMRPLDLTVERDNKFIAKLSKQLERFCDELDEFVEQCKRI